MAVMIYHTVWYSQFKKLYFFSSYFFWLFRVSRIYIVFIVVVLNQNSNKKDMKCQMTGGFFIFNLDLFSLHTRGDVIWPSSMGH